MGLSLVRPGAESRRSFWPRVMYLFFFLPRFRPACWCAGGGSVHTGATPGCSPNAASFCHCLLLPLALGAYCLGLCGPKGPPWPVCGIDGFQKTRAKGAGLGRMQKAEECHGKCTLVPAAGAAAMRTNSWPHTYTVMRWLYELGRVWVVGLGWG